MKRFFDNLPIAPRIALVLILVALTLAGLVATSDDVATKLLLSVLAGLMILIAARLSTPVEVRILWLRHASLIVAASFASGVTFFKNYVDHIFAKVRRDIKSPCPDLDRLCRDIASFMFERPNLGLEVGRRKQGRTMQLF